MVFEEKAKNIEFDELKLLEHNPWLKEMSSTLQSSSELLKPQSSLENEMSSMQQSLKNCFSSISSSIKRAHKEIRALIPPQLIIAHPEEMSTSLLLSFQTARLKTSKDVNEPLVREVTKSDVPNKLFLVDRDNAKIKEVKLPSGAVSEVRCSFLWV